MRTSTATGTPFRKTVQRGQKRYEYWAVQVIRDGRRKTLTAKTRAGVVALRDNPPVRPVAVLAASRTTVGAFLRSWIDGITARVAPNTARGWRSHIDVHLAPAFEDIALTDLTVNHVRAYLGRTDLAPQTLRHHRSTLRRALSDAVREGTVVRNVAGLAEPPRMPHKDRLILSPAEVKQLLDGTASDRLGPLWAVIGLTGLRISEALGLQWSDIDLGGGTLTVNHTLLRYKGEWSLQRPKTQKSRRTIPLAANLAVTLRAHRRAQMAERLAAGNPGGDGLVFVTVTGKPINASNAVAMLHVATERLGLPRVTVHSLRHSTATTLIASGFPIALVAAWLGHSTSRVTEAVYGHVTGNDLATGADVLDRMVR